MNPSGSDVAFVPLYSNEGQIFLCDIQLSFFIYHAQSVETRMHSSRMRTARSLTILGGVCLGRCMSGGGHVTYPINAFDVTCMLSIPGETHHQCS